MTSTNMYRVGGLMWNCGRQAQVSVSLFRMTCTRKNQIEKLLDIVWPPSPMDNPTIIDVGAFSPLSWIKECYQDFAKKRSKLFWYMQQMEWGIHKVFSASEDYVYFENSSSNPYLIRRIEELNKTTSGNVEAKVICFYRRRDISSSLLLLADKHAKDIEEDMDDDCTDLSQVQRHQLNHRELYLSRQLDTLPATHIRGKCSVTLLNETEDLKSYLLKTDSFFYSLVYDPTQKTLLADKGEIRVGSRYQAEVPPMLIKPKEDTRSDETLEELNWEPDRISEPQINRFLLVSRSVGTFARALDCNSSVRQPALHVCAASASRDITLFHAMQCIHKSDYNVADALTSLLPDGGPVLCRDEMEEWSPSEANLFEEALEKYGKDFRDIQQDFLPWKSLASIVEYYYMWKTSDRYMQQKRLKAAENESKLKQVYIPNYNKANPNQLRSQTDNDARACEGCFVTSSSSWYMWGPPNMGCKLCSSCWTYWKKYGGLKMPPSSRRERIQNPKIAGTDKELRYRHSSNASSMARNPRASHKTKQAFYLNATKLTRLARRLCRDILIVRHFSRQPFEAINVAAIKAECQLRLASNQAVSKPKPKKRSSLSSVVDRIAAQPQKISSPPRKKSLLLGNKISEGKLRSGHNSATKRPHQNGIDGQQGAESNGTFYQRIINGPQKKKRCPEQTNDDVIFFSTSQVRELRKQISAAEQRSAARRPTKALIKVAPAAQAILIDD